MDLTVSPVRRGDLARAHFHFSVRYRLPIPASEELALRAWHRADGPDLVEAARNTAIEALQGNRNPFVRPPRPRRAVERLLTAGRGCQMQKPRS